MQWKLNCIGLLLVTYLVHPTAVVCLQIWCRSKAADRERSYCSRLRRPERWGSRRAVSVRRLARNLPANPVRWTPLKWAKIVGSQACSHRSKAIVTRVPTSSDQAAAIPALLGRIARGQSRRWAFPKTRCRSIVIASQRAKRPQHTREKPARFLARGVQRPPSHRSHCQWPRRLCCTVSCARWRISAALHQRLSAWILWVL